MDYIKAEIVWNPKPTTPPPRAPPVCSLVGYMAIIITSRTRRIVRKRPSEAQPRSTNGPSPNLDVCSREAGKCRWISVSKRVLACCDLLRGRAGYRRAARVVGGEEGSGGRIGACLQENHL